MLGDVGEEERKLFVEMKPNKGWIERKRVVISDFVMRSGEVKNFELQKMKYLFSHIEIQFSHPPIHPTLVSSSFFVGVHRSSRPFFRSLFYFVLF
jgi:hypothetical protein